MKMLLRKTSLLLMVIGCFVISRPQAASAQGIITGTITGTITDASGAVVPGVPVVATNTATGIKITGKTDSAGGIKLSDVPVGTYTVEVTAPSFAPLKIDNLQVTSGGTSSVGTQHLSISGTAQEVSVSTAQNLLETSQAQITSTFETQSITDLPTGGGLDKLTLLIPGVVRTLGDNFSNTNGVGFSSNGQRGRSNNFEIDGQSNNATPSPAPSSSSATRTRSRSSTSSPTTTAHSTVAMPARSSTTLPRAAPTPSMAPPLKTTSVPGAAHSPKAKRPSSSASARPARRPSTVLPALQRSFPA